MTLADLLRLRWPLLAALVLAAAGAQLVWLAEAGHQSRREDLRRVEEEYRRSHSRLLEAERDEAQIRETIGRFRALEARGVVGPEQRLEWIERLRTARERLGLPALDYELRPRRPLQPGSTPPDSAAANLGEGYRLAASAMHLKADLVQEEDLLRLLTALAAEPSAIVRPTWCRMARAGATGLAAECELEWITVSPGAVK
jgi:hypothetical protein